MKEKFFLVLGILRVLVGDDYVGKGLRKEFRRLGRNSLNRMHKDSSSSVS